MRTMYDAVTAGNIPTTAEMVAGYVDPGGTFTWSAADWARFPTAIKVRIAGWASTNDGHVLDVEAGDATPAQAPGWVTRRRAAGIHPTVYCSEAVWAECRNQFTAQGVAQPEWWIAGYPGSAGAGRLYAGSIAHQYVDVGPYDLSVVADFWPGVDSPIAVTVTKEVDSMIVVFPTPFTTSIAWLMFGDFKAQEWVDSGPSDEAFGIPRAAVAWNAQPGRNFEVKFLDSATALNLSTAHKDVVLPASGLSEADIEKALRNVLHNA